MILLCFKSKFPKPLVVDNYTIFFVKKLGIWANTGSVFELSGFEY